MQIKDIVNRDLVNLTNCDQEPIHIPGSIQPHGFLLAVKEDTLVIDYCSGNIKDFTGVAYEQCLARKFSEIFGHESLSRLLAHLQLPVNKINPPLLIELNGKEWLCSPHKAPGLYICEFEPQDTAVVNANDIYNQTMQFVGYMEQSATLKELCSRVADQTRAITGYDRVMVYKFDKDYNGEVFAESKVDHIESFLGLHYPHTDIPVQARQLYLTNLMRIIVDIGYTPVPIYTIDDVPDKNLDLSKSYLRSVSPIHVEYLSNMGVGGTLTISLLHEGRLWGLITCHHYAPKYVPLYSRIAAQMQGHFLTSQIQVRQLNEEYKMAAEINASLEQLLDKAPLPDIDSFRTIITNPALLSLCSAGGVAVLFEGGIYKNGLTPPDDEVRALMLWLKRHTRDDKFHTTRLVDIYEPARAFSNVGAGIIYYSLSGLQNDGIIWFTPETLEEVFWAGDPDNAILKTEKGLSPRNSFRLWKQRLQYQSREWSNPELVATETYVHALQKHITLILITEEERKQRELTRQLQEANAELENINWISSHDLKEPLRKIQLFSSKILDKEQRALSETAVNSLKKVTRSAHKMQQLLTDITMYNKVRHASAIYERVALDGILHAVADDVKDDLTERGASLVIGRLPEIEGIPILLKQLFLNLVYNALKFSRKDVPSVIDVHCEELPVKLPEQGGQYYKVVIRDNGIGFDNAYNESIFKVFSRLHSQSDYEGSGVGLALCRKIMQNHKGFIIAEGQHNKGATFSLYFPAV